MKTARTIAWCGVAMLGAYGLGLIAFVRGENRPSAPWFVVASACIYAVGYRFYSRFIATRVLELDDSRPTPAMRLADEPDPLYVAYFRFARRDLPPLISPSRCVRAYGLSPAI